MRSGALGRGGEVPHRVLGRAGEALCVAGPRVAELTIELPTVGVYRGIGDRRDRARDGRSGRRGDGWRRRTGPEHELSLPLVGRHGRADDGHRPSFRGRRPVGGPLGRSAPRRTASGSAGKAAGAPRWAGLGASRTARSQLGGPRTVADEGVPRRRGHQAHPRAVRGAGMCSRGTVGPIGGDRGCAVLGFESLSSRRLVGGLPLSGVLTVAPLRPVTARALRLDLVLLEHVAHGPWVTDDPARSTANEEKDAEAPRCQHGVGGTVGSAPASRPALTGRLVDPDSP